MADDLSWIDHPANLRANAALLRAIAEQSLLHADEIERLRNMLDNVMSVRRPRGGTMNDLVERLRRINGWTNEPDASPLEAADEIERLNGLAARQDGLIERLRAEIAEWKNAADANTPEAFRLQMKADGERDD